MKVVTNHSIAINSNDHLYPWGTAFDNNTNHLYIQDVIDFFGGNTIKVLDIGCSGGQLIVDFHNRGHIAVGIEGSDYSVINNRANWPQYHNKILFTCDATKPYTIIDDDNNPIQFDCISAWEVIEHISPNDIDQFFKTILQHMHENSIFLGSISTVGDYHDGNGRFDKKVELHSSVFSEEVWKTQILNNYFNIEDYPFQNKLRNESTSFYVKLTKKKI